MDETRLQKAEDMHYKFQMGCYFHGSIEIPGACLLWNNKIKDFYWNYATKINPEEKDILDLIREIIAFYKMKNLRPAIYFTPFTRPKNLPGIIKKLGFKSKFKDIWMFYEQPEPKIAMPENFSIKQVGTKEEM